jgi:hypothetical protein
VVAISAPLAFLVVGAVLTAVVLSLIVALLDAVLAIPRLTLVAAIPHGVAIYVLLAYVALRIRILLVKRIDLLLVHKGKWGHF